MRLSSYGAPAGTGCRGGCARSRMVVAGRRFVPYVILSTVPWSAWFRLRVHEGVPGWPCALVSAQPHRQIAARDRCDIVARCRALLSWRDCDGTWQVPRAWLRAVHRSWLLLLLSPLLAFDDLKKAVTAHADVSNRVRMHRRFSSRHQNPFLALEMRRQSSAGHRGHAQGSIGCSAIDVVDNLVGHQMRIARQPLAAIASVLTD